MKFFRNLKHIFAVTLISLLIISSSVFVFGKEFTHALSGFFVYRTGGDVWQDKIYRHTLTPSDDIVIVKIDEKTLNSYVHDPRRKARSCLSKRNRLRYHIPECR